MVGFLRSGSSWSQVPARLAGTVGLAVLLALGSLFSLAPPALAGGSGAIIYTHTATSANTQENFTLLDNAVTNNNPNALVEVTANWNPNGTYTGFDTHQVGVWYDSSAAKWGIFNEGGASMPLGAAFNVYALPSSSAGVFVQTVTSANTSGYITFLNSAGLNGNPSASFLVTQNWNPGGGGVGIYHTHAIGVWYDTSVGEWTIYNEDISSLPSGASFNIVTITGVTDQVTQVASSSNIVGDSTCLSESSSDHWNTNPNSVLFITHVYSGYFTDVAAVWFNASLNEQCVFDGSYHSMPVGVTFFVVN